MNDLGRYNGQETYPVRWVNNIYWLRFYVKQSVSVVVKSIYLLKLFCATPPGIEWKKTPVMNDNSLLLSLTLLSLNYKLFSWTCCD